MYDNMTVLVWAAMKNSSILPLATPVEWCDNDGICRAADMDAGYFPRPINHIAPFPLTGEGIKPKEIAQTINVKAAKQGGHIRVHSEGVHAISGPHLHATVLGTTWSECLRDDPSDLVQDNQESEDTPVHLTLHFPLVRMSSLAVYKLVVKTSACTGRLGEGNAGPDVFRPSATVQAVFPLERGSP